MKRIVSIVMAVAMLMICGPVKAGDVEDCTNAESLLKSNPSRVVSACRRLAERGEAWAEYNLGLMYAHGRGVPQNDKDAAKWYRLAAAQGYAWAQVNLGMMYQLGLGVPQDDKEAVNWYRLAADRGVPEAQYNLGLIYEAGQAVNIDLVQAYVWFVLAARAYPAGADRVEAINAFDRVAREMTPEQIAKAKKLAADWKPKPGAPAQAKSACKTIILEQNHEIAVLEGDTRVWSIKNTGPASAVIQTKGDPTFRQRIAPDPGAVTIFAGDARYTYTIALIAPGKKATLQVCQ